MAIIWIIAVTIVAAYAGCVLTWLLDRDWHER